MAAINLRCGVSATHDLDRYHYDHVRDRLAPSSELPAADDGIDRRGPAWLRLAARSYTEHAYEATIGEVTLEEIHAREASVVRHETFTLDSLRLHDDLISAGFQEARALAFLAGEWLAGRAGEAALFDYFRHLPSSDGWEAAFEAAFGMSVEDFQAEFEAYRAEVAPPYVLHHIRGVVLDPAGNPSVGAWVAANRGEGRWEDTATTGADGSFELAVRDGSYDLAVDLTTTGCSVPTDDRQYPGGMTEVDGADVSGIEIRLPEGAVCAQS